MEPAECMLRSFFMIQFNFIDASFAAPGNLLLLSLQ